MAQAQTRAVFIKLVADSDAIANNSPAVNIRLGWPHTMLAGLLHGVFHLFTFARLRADKNRPHNGNGRHLGMACGTDKMLVARIVGAQGVKGLNGRGQVRQPQTAGLF